MSNKNERTHKLLTISKVLTALYAEPQTKKIAWSLAQKASEKLCRQLDEFYDSIELGITLAQGLRSSESNEVLLLDMSDREVAKSTKSGHRVPTERSGHL